MPTARGPLECPLSDAIFFRHPKALPSCTAPICPLLCPLLSSTQILNLNGNGASGTEGPAVRLSPTWSAKRRVTGSPSPNCALLTLTFVSASTSLQNDLDVCLALPKFDGQSLPFKEEEVGRIRRTGRRPGSRAPSPDARRGTAGLGPAGVDPLRRAPARCAPALCDQSCGLFSPDPLSVMRRVLCFSWFQ